MLLKKDYSVIVPILEEEEEELRKKTCSSKTPLADCFQKMELA